MKTKRMRIHQLVQLATVATLLISASFSTQAKERVNQTLDTSDAPNIEFEHVAGEIGIQGWDNNTVKVEGELGERTEDFIFQQSGNDVVIKVKTDHRNVNYQSDKPHNGDKLTVFVPAKSRLTYNAVVAEVKASGLKSDSKFEMVNGDLSVTDLSGRVKIVVVNADVALKNIQGKLSVETVNGDIEGRHKGNDNVTLRTVNGDIEFATTSPRVLVDSVNGDSELNLARIQSLSLSTVNGDMEAGLILMSDGDIDASSVGGKIELSLQPDVSARFELQAHAGGDIINRITNDKPQSAKYGPSEWLNFTVNGGSARVEMSTVHGELSLETSSD
ncbi:hypothetical protein [Alteromonas sp. 14N.309.X.WAT.G.H12]|uniref:DUF4097 family beta strand repeat-containing protein n=1 Tax=Alteromonas sp. 14N.309.X.WAT.G.H12 TaxID=3120824 RepID=UPI002FD2050B